MCVAAPVTLYLIRHGETEVNRHNCVQGRRIDPPLNARGRRQAECVGQRFRGEPVDWVVTSPARRAVETGAAIRSHHPAVPLSRRDALSELAFGDLEGTHVTAGYMDLVERWDRDGQADLAAPGSGGESPAACARRAMDCLANVVGAAAAEGQRHVCVVAHSRLIQIVLAAMLDGSLGTMGAYKQRKAAVNVVDARADPARPWGLAAAAREINSTAHMPDHVVSVVSSTAPQSQEEASVCFDVDAAGEPVLQRLPPHCAPR
ncbi:hypothetical protein GGF46_002354 [Coemansia sp. RSA 552]|nr:hypothetical protein GGF46_002354 [Coemansia sp. RSA 552]